jgi:NAD(P)H-dependent FMN reductase
VSIVKVLGISGSMRSPSATGKAVQIALDGAAAFGAEVDYIDISTLDLPFCDGRVDIETYPENVHEFRRAIRSAQGIILGTPEYHNSMTGALKNAIDLCLWDDFAQKMVGVIGVAGGAIGAINSINHTRTVMRGVGAWVVPHQVSIAHSGKAFDHELELLEPALLDRLHRLGRDVTKFSRLIAAGLIDIDETQEV